MSEHLPHNGMVSQIVNEAFKLSGVNVQYQYYPWIRAESLASIGKVDGSLIWSKNPEREVRFLYSDPVMKISIHLFYPKIKPLEWNKLEDLVGRKVGVTRSYAYGVQLLDLIKTGQIRGEEGISDEQNLHKLLIGRIDVFPMHKEVGIYLMENELSIEKQNKIAFHPKPLSELDYHLIISRNIPNGMDLINKFNSGLKQLKASGRYNQLVNQRRSWNDKKISSTAHY